MVLTRSPSTMASMHYGTPSSLPSDYALLSRYANARGMTNGDEPIDDFYDPSDPSDAHNDGIPIRPTARRSSFPSPYLRPLQPKLPESFASKVSFPAQYSPLLVPLIVYDDTNSTTDPATSPTAAQD